MDDRWADIVVLKSVLTHQLPEDVAHSLGELRRVLVGKALVTVFCYAGVDEAVERTFPHAASGYRYIREGSPESGIAYERSWLEAQMDDVGLTSTYLPGFWHGVGCAYQDIFVVTPR